MTLRRPPRLWENTASANWAISTPATAPTQRSGLRAVLCRAHRSAAETAVRGRTMALQAYSLARDGSTALSPHFCVREFRCKDGSDPVFIDMALAELLERIREHFGKPVTITSAHYAPRHHNAKGRRGKVQPAPVWPGSGYPGTGRERGGRGRLRRKPDAGPGRRGTLPRQGGPRRRLGARGYPGRQSPVEGVSAIDRRSSQPSLQAR